MTNMTNWKMNGEFDNASNISVDQKAKPSVNIQQIKENFDEIKIKLHHLLLDPLLSTIFAPFKCCF